MINFFEKYPLATLSLVVIIMLLIQLGVPDVTIMEARNFITAREILNNNNWLLTTMNGEARYQKPPLPTWLSAISASIFGVKSLFALRLPAALMVLFTGVFSYYLSLKLAISKSHSLNNALILVTSFYVFAIINEAPWDIYTHGFMMAGLYFLFQFFEKQDLLWKNMLLSAFFIGLSIMSKGPVSLFALFLPFLIAYAIVYNFKKFNKKIIPFICGILLFILIGGWWYIYVRLIDPKAFLEIATTETGNWSSYNVKPFYFYWSFFTQSGLWAISAFIGLLYPYLSKRVKNKKAYKFTFLWTIISVILLSIIPEKKPRYLMPVLLPLALNTSFYIQYLISKFSKLSNKKETLPVYLNFGLIALIALSLPVALFVILKQDIQQYITNYVILSICCIAIGLFILKNLYTKKIKNVFYLTVILVVTILTFGLPISKSLNKNKNFKAINSLHLIEKTNNIKAYTIGEVSPELLWDYNGILKNIYKNAQLNIPLENSFGLLIMKEDVKKITSQLENNYTYKLVETYNLNVGAKKKERLIRELYIISKK